MENRKISQTIPDKKWRVCELGNKYSSAPLTTSPTNQVAMLDKCCSVEKALRQNKVSYHKICFILLIDNTKLHITEKRSADTTDEGGGAESHQKVQQTKHFLCKNKGGELREAMTRKVKKVINQFYAQWWKTPPLLNDIYVIE